MFRRILFPFDGTLQCLNAAGYVADLAERLEAHVTVLHVIRAKAWSGRSVEEMKERLGAILSPYPASPVRFRLAEGPVGPRIIEHAQNEATDLIVLPVQHRHRWPRPFRLPILRHVVNSSPCAVWTIPAPARQVPAVSRILCAADNGRYAQHTVDVAARLARLLEASLHLVYAIPEIDISMLARMALDPPLLSETEARAHLRSLAQNAGVQAKVIATQGPVTGVVGRAIQETGAGLLVVGRSGGGAASHTLRLLGRVKHPMLVVPHPASGVRRRGVLADDREQSGDRISFGDADPLVRLGPGAGSVRGS